MLSGCWECFQTIVDELLAENEVNKVSLVSASYNENININAIKLFDQDFTTMRAEYQAKGELFEDVYCPSLKETDQEITWLRPGEITEDPKFYVDGFSRFDTNQGATNNCWFVVAAGNLTLQNHLFHRVVPADNSNYGDDTYAGIFHFRFWQYDVWYDVVIDDRLPTLRKNGEIQLLFMKSTEKNEFWSALLEKAYAKLYNTYDIYFSGKTAEAMQDFTGGITEIHFMENVEENFFDLLLENFSTKTMMVAEIDAFDKHMPMGHAFSITDVIKKEIASEADSKELQLIRLRNPWGDESEWPDLMAWNDNLPEWQRISNDLLERVDIVDHADDGEFWMTFDDFTQYFQRIQFCNVWPADESKWTSLSFSGEWKREMAAGGDARVFWLNPQYRIELSSPDTGNECTVFIGLVQKNRRKNGEAHMNIKFKVYQGSEVNEQNEVVADSGSFMNLREVSAKLEFPPGQYTIIPGRMNENSSGEFLLRVFTKATCKELQ